MNIFALHPNPRKSARWHVDKHVVKMILETCQLLFTAHWVLRYPQLQEARSPIALSRMQKPLTPPLSMKTAPLTKSGTPYRPCHVNHPSAIWARETAGNYIWLTLLGLELCREFRHRYKHPHACEPHLIWLNEHLPRNLPMKPRQGFAIAMADEYKISKDPIVCYRNYYRTSKQERGLIEYTNRHKPHWL